MHSNKYTQGIALDPHSWNQILNGLQLMSWHCLNEFMQTAAALEIMATLGLSTSETNQPANSTIHKHK